MEKLPNYDYGSDNSKTKYRDMTIKGLGIPAQETSMTGLPSVDTNVLV